MRYMLDEEHGLELIVTENSERNYPLHNHVSVDIVGLVVEGSVRMVIAGVEKVCNPGELFVVSAYTPHALECIQPYSLMVLCMRTNGAKSAEGNLAKLGKCMEQYPQQRLSIEEMAEKIFLSKYQMIRNFKKEIGFLFAGDRRMIRENSENRLYKIALSEAYAEFRRIAGKNSLSVRAGDGV